MLSTHLCRARPQSRVRPMLFTPNSRSHPSPGVKVELQMAMAPGPSSQPASVFR